MATTTSASSAPSANRSWVDILGSLWAWLFLGFLLLIFAIGSPVFFTPVNLQNILANMVLLTIVAFGQTFVIITGGIDLSAGWVMGMVSVISAIIMNRFSPETPLWLVVIAGLGAGLVAAGLAGLVNGLLIARMKVPPFIATLGMFGIARGVGFLVSGGMPVPVRVEGIGRLGNGYLLYFHPTAGWSFFSQPAGLAQSELRQVMGILPYVLIVLLVLFVVAHLLLSRSRFGLHTYAIGGSQEAALRAGIPVGRRLIMIYVLCASFAAVSGVLYNMRFTNGAANAGESMVLDTVAAVVIGGASLSGGAGTLVGTMIGSLIIAVLNNGLVIMGINPFWQFIAVGVVIIMAVLIDQARDKLVRS